jgi:hypothetical protein
LATWAALLIGHDRLLHRLLILRDGGFRGLQW